MRWEDALREERPGGARCYLLLGFGLFHGHGAVVLVLLEHAEVADAGLVHLAEEFHGLAMQGALAGLEVPDGLEQLVVTEGGALQVGLEVQLAEGGLAHQAGLEGLLLVADARVAQDLLGARLGAREVARGGPGGAVPLEVPRLRGLAGLREDGLARLPLLGKGDGWLLGGPQLEPGIGEPLAFSRVHAEVVGALIVHRLNKLDDGPPPLVAQEQGGLSLAWLQGAAQALALGRFPAVPVGDLGLFAFGLGPSLQAALGAQQAAGTPGFQAGPIAPGDICSFHCGSPGWSVSGSLEVRWVTSRAASRQE